METKKCLHCNAEKSIYDFYKHPKMKDGRTNVCCECTKKAIRENYKSKSNNPTFIEKERQRGRDKYKRLNYSKRKSAHEENKNTRRNLINKGINLTGMEIHHWNYLLSMDVFILTIKAHRLIHKFLIFDETTQMFIYNEMLLDSKEKHLDAIVDILKTEKLDYEIGFYPLKK